jgi:hypothetical protein
VIVGHAQALALRHRGVPRPSRTSGRSPGVERTTPFSSSLQTRIARRGSWGFPPVRAVVLRTGLSGPTADQRVSDNGQQLGRVARQHREIERLVAVVEMLQIELPGDAARHGLELSVSTFCLLVKRQHRRRQPAGEAQLRALPHGERDSPVADPVVQDRMGARHRLTVSHDVSLFSGADLVLRSVY